MKAPFADDRFGRRRAKTVGSVTTGLLYDGLKPVQELAGGSPVANLLTGLGIDEFFTRTDRAGTVSHVTDALDSSVALADGSGTIQSEYSCEPFGETRVSGASTTSAFGFTGREDDGTELYYYRGAVLRSVPAAARGGRSAGVVAADVNLHGYVQNSPTAWVDPLGLDKWPPNPSGLGPEWKLDPTHKYPHGERYRDPTGRPLDWHLGRPGERGWGGKDHWHDPNNFGKKHLPPGTEIPDAQRLPQQPQPQSPNPSLSQGYGEFLLGLGGLLPDPVSLAAAESLLA
jgi:hypothetical protein